MLGFLQSLIHRIAPSSALRNFEHHPKVTNMELFFDLVYVFTIIQLSHYLIEHPTWIGAFQALTIFAAIWWSWNYTAWATNWIDPDKKYGRTLIAVLMFLALGMAVAIPEAYETTAGFFVGAYLMMSLLRAGYMSLIFRGTPMSQNYFQLGIWSLLAGLVWIAGIFVEPEWRMIIWFLAVCIDYIAPTLEFWLPKLGKRESSSWPLSSEHLSERNQQLFIIALGESILLMGSTLLQQGFSLFTLGVTVLGFISLFFLWLIYFVKVSHHGEKVFELTDKTEHTNMARVGFAYAHGIIIAGTIVCAVAIEQTIAHPDHYTSIAPFIIALLGPIIYLLGIILFHWSLTKHIPLRYVVGVILVGFVGIVVWLFHFSPVVMAALISLIFIVIGTKADRFLTDKLS